MFFMFLLFLRGENSGGGDGVGERGKYLKISNTNSYQKKELRNDTARGSTAGFGGTGVCVGVRFVSLPSGEGARIKW